MEYEYYAEPRQVYVLSTRSFGRYHNDRNCSRLDQSDPDEIAEGRVLTEREIQFKENESIGVVGVITHSDYALDPRVRCPVCKDHSVQK